jgi:homopolymeric O-antigen transport system permease protein
MTSTTPESIAPGHGAASSRLAELFGVHGAADLTSERAADAIEVIDYRPPPFKALAEAWRYRRLVPIVFWAVLVQMLTQYRLGPTWMVLQTFMSLVGNTLIFGGGVFKVKTPGGMPYVLYLMVGMMGWNLFLQTMMMSTRGFQRVKILKNFHLPLLLIPIVGSAQGVIRAVIYMIGYGFMILYLWAARGHLYLQLSPKLLAISLLGLTLCLVFAWGMGMWTAPLYAWAKDVRYVLRMATPFWMLLTPILYPLDHLHGKTRLLAELNPVASPIEMVKVGLLGAGSVHLHAAIFSIATIAVVFISGVWFITRFGHRLANVGSAQMAEITDDDDDIL